MPKRAKPHFCNFLPLPIWAKGHFLPGQALPKRAKGVFFTGKACPYGQRLTFVIFELCPNGQTPSFTFFLLCPFGQEVFFQKFLFAHWGKAKTRHKPLEYPLSRFKHIYMTEINKISKNTRVGEANNLGGNLNTELHNTSVNDPNITTVKESLDSIMQRFNEAVNKIKAESVLDEADVKRDTTTRSLLYLNQGFLLHPDNTINKAAQAVDGVLGRYGFEITSLNYSSQSASTLSLIRDLRAPEILPSVELLPGMLAIVDQLEVDQKNFKEAEMKWNEATAEEGESESATEIKREMIELINNKLVVYLRAMVQFDPATYTELTNNIATHIDRANEVVKRRQTLNEEVEN
jgi:hypothetical protein